MTIETYLDDLATYLQTNGIGTVGTDIHFMGLDTGIINDVSLTPYAGSEYNKILTGEINPYRPNLSILVRNSSASAALSKTTSIYKLLRVVCNQLIGTTKFIYIDARSPPGFVSKSDTGAFIFSVNFELFIQ